MTDDLHRPGRPEDLPPADLLWARWAVLAAVTADPEEVDSRHRHGYWHDAEGLHLDDSGCTWWTLTRVAGDGSRAVLYGEDESSGVKWHEPAIDVLAGAPAWLPHEELRKLVESDELGCVYWYENGAWARAAYPDGLDDDGLDCGMSRLATFANAVTEAWCALDEMDGPEPRPSREDTARLVTAAEGGTVTEEFLRPFLNADASAAALASAAASGLVPR
ncbi:hypothetical protein [Streptomyces sp. NPDC000410]|uniref:hypothetical protein n=1 Tax=Streptomyces sp. NPDC000410 TaxID=3154254 RepID=UPI0033249F86